MLTIGGNGVFLGQSQFPNQLFATLIGQSIYDVYFEPDLRTLLPNSDGRHVSRTTEWAAPWGRSVMNSRRGAKGAQGIRGAQGSVERKRQVAQMKAHVKSCQRALAVATESETKSRASVDAS